MTPPSTLTFGALLRPTHLTATETFTLPPDDQRVRLPAHRIAWP